MLIHLYHISIYQLHYLHAFQCKYCKVNNQNSQTCHYSNKTRNNDSNFYSSWSTSSCIPINSSSFCIIFLFLYLILKSACCSILNSSHFSSNQYNRAYTTTIYIIKTSTNSFCSYLNSFQSDSSSFIHFKTSLRNNMSETFSWTY